MENTHKNLGKQDFLTNAGASNFGGKVNPGLHLDKIVRMTKIVSPSSLCLFPSTIPFLQCHTEACTVASLPRFFALCLPQVPLAPGFLSASGRPPLLQDSMASSSRNFPRFPSHLAPVRTNLCFLPTVSVYIVTIVSLYHFWGGLFLLPKPYVH
jgi:hypothetical protein